MSNSFPVPLYSGVSISFGVDLDWLFAVLAPKRYVLAEGPSCELFGFW